jgi:uncharacterized protein (TIGR03435 family)
MRNKVTRELSVAKTLMLRAAGPAVLFSLTLFGVLNLSRTQAQSEQISSSRFEVVSIKPNTSHDDNPRIAAPAGGRFAAGNVTVGQLMRSAYQIQDFQLSGQPSWFDSDRYDVEAKAAGNASTPEMRVMLQNLLAERFKLTFHRGTKEFPAFALIVAGNGPKLRLADPEKCVPRPASSCSVIRTTSPTEIVGEQITMARFAVWLSTRLDRTVIDRTDLEGVFDLDLRWEPDQPAVVLDAVPPNTVPPPIEPNLSILTAIREQLGLKLESTKTVLEIFVIDRVERPSAN